MRNDFLNFFDKKLKPDLAAFKTDRENAKNRDYFKPSGVQVFTGLQGQGKTYSMVRTLLKIHKRYPKAIIVTNLKLNKKLFGEYLSFDDLDSLGDKLTGVNNGIYGVVYAIDEIHSYFNALDSKSIPSYVFTEISQQRKQRKLILGTSQLYLRLAKPFREQCDHLITCSCFFGKLIINNVYIGATLVEDFGVVYGDRVKTGFYWQTQNIRDSYDTYQKIQSGREEYNNNLMIQQMEQFKKPRGFRRI